VAEASSYLENNRAVLDRLADLLCEHETIDGVQIEALFEETKKLPIPKESDILAIIEK
jgi:ATP-dependent Zn protease